MGIITFHIRFTWTMNKTPPTLHRDCLRASCRTEDQTKAFCFTPVEDKGLERAGPEKAVKALRL